MQVTNVTIVRYKTTNGSGEENERLIRNVFGELKEGSPEGLRYLVLRADDGTFVHLAAAAGEASPLRELATFRTFRTGINERCVEAPQSVSATVLGNYMFLA
jgi:hypothetical protein